jgi:drug/metabolite transporter (DMT)-like permease
MTNSPRRKALQMLLLCTAFWALSFPLMKALAMLQQGILPAAGSWFFTSCCVMLRFSLAGILLLFTVFPELKTITRRELEQGLGLAFAASAGVGFQMDGLNYVSTSVSAFLTQLYCVLIPLWVALSARRFPALRIFICSALVLTGMAVLVKLNPAAIRLGRGELETLAGSVMFTGQILYLECPRFAGNRPRLFTTVMLLGMGLFAVPWVVVTAPHLKDCLVIYQSAPAIGLLTVLVLVCSLVPFLMMNRWQREVTATEAGLVYCAEPVVVSILALFLPAWLSRAAQVNYANEPVTVRLLVGGGLITAANILLQSPWLDRRPPGGSVRQNAG